ncbi:hypothetical protein LINPERHAP1_LOCUS10474, partial [Linum perenne]
MAKRNATSRTFASTTNDDEQNKKNSSSNSATTNRGFRFQSGVCR